MSLADYKLPTLRNTAQDVTGLVKNPSANAQINNMRFDLLVKNVMRSWFNNLIDGITSALSGKLDTSDADDYVKVSNIGWIPLSDTFTYASADSPTFVMTVPGNVTGYIYPGTKIKLTQTSTKYFICTASAYSSPNTTITLYGGTDYTLANASISDVYYSHEKAPAAFPLDPDKWSEKLTDTASRASTTDLTSWQNLGSLQKNVPIGCWRIWYRVYLKALSAAATPSNYPGMLVSLSTSPTAVSDTDYTCKICGNNALECGAIVSSDVKTLTLAAKTLYYMIAKASGASTSQIHFENNESKFFLIAECAYL